MNPAGLFVNTATINNPATAVAADGSYTTVASLSEPVSCSIQPMSSSESIQYARRASGEFCRMYCAVGVSINGESSVTDEAAVVYRVAGIARNTGGRGVFLTIDLERIK